MQLLRGVRQKIGRYRHVASVARHRSRMPSFMARRYTEYLGRARRAYAGQAPQEWAARAAEDIHARGFATFHTPETQRVADAIYRRVRLQEERGEPIWDAEGRYQEQLWRALPELEALFGGPLGDFLNAAYRSNFKIWYGVLYKSTHGDRPSGSQLWHSDGGPGTCTNVMFYLHDVTPEHGAMECVPWPRTLEIYRAEYLGGEPERRIQARRPKGERLTREEQRDIVSGFYGEEIARYPGTIVQPTGPAGLVLPFSNNILHKGGYPQPGYTRYVMVFHCYPSVSPPPFDKYRAEGIPKRAPYPQDPAEGE